MDNHLKEEVEILENMLREFELFNVTDYSIDRDEARAFFKICEQVNSDCGEYIGVTSEFLEVVASCLKDYKKQIKKDLKNKIQNFKNEIKGLEKQIKEME